MNIKLLFFSVAALLLSACTNQATGQLDRNLALKTTIDSVSYGIGTDVGQNLQMNLEQSGLDSLNLDALVAGIRDGLDGVERISAENVRNLVQAYMIKAQQEMMAQQKAKDSLALEESRKFLAENGKRPEVVTTPSGLQYEVLQMGKGDKPTVEQTVTVHYRGTLVNGKQFDSSYDRGEPAQFPVGAVIPGWTEALQLMPVGSHWKLYIPSELGYGEHGAPPNIPGNSALIFEVELLDIAK